MVKKSIHKINNYFFDADQITVSDSLWFYGSIVLVLLIGISILFL